MSTRERAVNIVNQMSEEQLQGFISLFGMFYVTPEDGTRNKAEVAYDDLMQMLHPIPEIDEKKELEEYRKEKYGEGIY